MFNKNINTIILLVMSSCSIFCMEMEKGQKINSWEEVSSFARRVIAYRFEARNEEGYGWVRDYILTWDNEQMGYELKRLIEKNKTPRTIGLVDDAIKELIPTLRLITKEEYTHIKNCINSGSHIFEYYNKEKSIECLDSAIKHDALK